MAHGQRIIPTEASRLSVPMDVSTTIGTPYVYDVSGMAQVTVEGVPRGPTDWSASGIVTVYRSNSGESSIDLETATTIRGDSRMSPSIDVNFRYLNLQCTNAEAGVLVEFFVWGVPLE